MNDPIAQLIAAFSRFASSRTIADALPPSSSSTGLMYFPAVAEMMDPTCVLPVKFTLRIAGCAIKALVTAAASDDWW